MYEVDTENAVACKLFCKFAHANGWRGSMYTDPTYVERFFWLVLDTESKRIAGNTGPRGHKTVSLETAMDIILDIEQYQNLILDDIAINGETPEITPSGDLIIGCTTIPYDVVCQIYRHVVDYVKWGVA